MPQQSIDHLNLQVMVMISVAIPIHVSIAQPVVSFNYSHAAISGCKGWSTCCLRGLRPLQSLKSFWSMPPIDRVGRPTHCSYLQIVLWVLPDDLQQALQSIPAARVFLFFMFNNSLHFRVNAERGEEV